MSRSIKINDRFISEELTRVENLILSLTCLAFIDLQPRFKQPPRHDQNNVSPCSFRHFRGASLIYREVIIVKRHRSHALHSVLTKILVTQHQATKTEISQSSTH